MTTEYSYLENEKFKMFEKIMNTQNYLTQDEYDFCVEWDGDVKHDLFKGDGDSKYDYLNLRIETQKQIANDDYQLRVEIGF